MRVWLGLSIILSKETLHTIVVNKFQPQFAIPVSAAKNEYLVMYQHIATLLTTGREDQGHGKRVVAVTGSNINPYSETELTVIDQGGTSEALFTITQNTSKEELVAEKIKLEDSCGEP
jgi:hypothetical protein